MPRDFDGNSQIPPGIVDKVLDMQMRESERNAQQNNSGLWDDDMFPNDGDGAPDDYEPESPLGYGAEDDENEETPESQSRSRDEFPESVAIENLREVLEDLLDQQRQVTNNVASIELSISSIRDALKENPKDINIAEMAQSFKEMLEGFSTENISLLDKKFSYFTRENIKELFDQIDQRMRVLNERDKGWQTALQKATGELGKKVIIWTLVFGFGFSFITSICFIMLYGALKHVLPLL